MPSPWVQRALDAQRESEHRAEQWVDPTLGARIRADRRFAPSEREIADIERDEAQHRAERTAYDLSH